MYGELGRETTVTRNVWKVGYGDDCHSKCMESWVGERLSLEMYGELGRGRLSLEMYGELGRGTTATRNVWRVG